MHQAIHGRVLSQLTSDQVISSDLIFSKCDFAQQHLMTYFSKKMILAETCYKTHNGKLLAIVEVFKTWQYYLKGCKHEVLVFANHNDLLGFMDIKNLSFRQVRQAQKLFCYYFQITYCRGKANVAANAISCYFQKSLAKEKNFQNENTQILYHLQSLLTNTSLKSFNVSLFSSTLSPLYQFFVCGTHILLQLL